MAGVEPLSKGGVLLAKMTTTYGDYQHTLYRQDAWKRFLHVWHGLVGRLLSVTAIILEMQDH